MSTAPAPATTDPRALAFGQQLADARLRAGLSQHRLAHLTGFDHSFISRIERGERAVAHPTVAALAETLGSDRRETALLYRAAGYWPDSPHEALIIAIEEYTSRPACPGHLVIVAEGLLALMRAAGDGQ